MHVRVRVCMCAPLQKDKYPFPRSKDPLAQRCIQTRYSHSQSTLAALNSSGPQAFKAEPHSTLETRMPCQKSQEGGTVLGAALGTLLDVRS